MLTIEWLIEWLSKNAKALFCLIYINEPNSTRITFLMLTLTDFVGNSVIKVFLMKLISSEIRLIWPDNLLHE